MRTLLGRRSGGVWKCLVPVLLLGLVLVPVGAQEDDFYHVPADIGTHAIGGVVRSEPTTALSPTLRFAQATRVMYRSEDETGRAVGITGVVLVPAGRPPAGGWPVVAWAHGTTGVGLDCAPSKTPNLFEESYAAFVAGLLSAGYLVVATDYEGLGTGPLHKYLNLDSEARSVIDGVRAARALVPEAGDRWVVVGHSQGGHAAVGTGELASHRAPELRFLGSVPVAPGADLITAFGGIEGSAHREHVLPYISYLAAGIKATHPGFDYAEVLSPEMLPLMPLVEQLNLTELGLFFELVYLPEKVLAENWRESATAVEYLTTCEPGQRPSAGPLLVLEGAADVDVAPALVEVLVDRLERSGQAVDFRKLPGDDHETILRTAFPLILDWIHERFHGSASAGLRVSPLTGQATRLLALLQTDLELAPFFEAPLEVEARAVSVNLAAAKRALAAAQIRPAAAGRIRAPLSRAIAAADKLRRVVRRRQAATRMLARAATEAGRAEREARRAGL